ncbi:MAG: Ig-like domain-containing protein [Oscillospiraceae bacterium]
MSEATQAAKDAKLKALRGAYRGLVLLDAPQRSVDRLSETMKNYFDGQNHAADHAITLHMDTKTRSIQVCVFQPEVPLLFAMQGSGMKTAFTDPPVLNITAPNGTHAPLINGENQRDTVGAALSIADAIGTQFGVDPYSGTLADVLIAPEELRDMQFMFGCGTAETHTAPTRYNAIYTLRFYESPLRVKQTAVTLTRGDTQRLKAITKLPGALHWISSDASVATVDQTGLVTAVGSGSATISLTAAGYTGFPAQTNILVKS